MMTLSNKVASFDRYMHCVRILYERTIESRINILMMGPMENNWHILATVI